MDRDLTTKLNDPRITKSRLIGTKMTAENRTKPPASSPEPSAQLIPQLTRWVWMQQEEGDALCYPASLLGSRQGCFQESSGSPVLGGSVCRGSTFRQLSPRIVQQRCARDLRHAPKHLELVPHSPHCCYLSKKTEMHHRFTYSYTTSCCVGRLQRNMNEGQNLS